MIYRHYIVDAKDNSNIRTEDVEVEEGQDPSEKVELNEGERIGNTSQLSEAQ